MLRTTLWWHDLLEGALKRLVRFVRLKLPCLVYEALLLRFVVWFRFSVLCLETGPLVWGLAYEALQALGD